MPGCSNGSYTATLSWDNADSNWYAEVSTDPGFTEYWKSDDLSNIMALLFVVVMIIFFIVRTKIIHYSSLCYFPITFLSAYYLQSAISHQVKWNKYLPVLLLFFGFCFSVLLLGVPLAVLLMFIAWKYLTSFAFSFQQIQFPGGKEEIKRLQKELGPLGFEEKTVLVVFCLTAICWMTRSYLLAPILPGIDDTIIAIAAALLIFLLPTKNKAQKSLLTWEQAVKLPWGVLLLFGGGLALAEGFATTGLAEWIGQQMTSFENISLFLMLILIVASVNFLTEITSNTATTSMLLPVIVPTALVLNVHPYPLMIGVALAASCAFMLPVATPPNAIVFGSGYLTIPNMLKTGVWMNILSIILIVLLIYFGLPIIWDLELNEFPKYLK